MFFAKMTCKRLRKKAEKLRHLREDGDNKAVHKEIIVLKDLAKFYFKKQGAKKFPNAEFLGLECLRNAAMLGDKAAQYEFGDKMLKLANFWQELQSTFLGCAMHKQYADLSYEQSFAYLEQAETQGHPLAKRLIGLSLVRGWGKEPNKELGTKLIIESIKEEGTWDKATEIFQKLGLHSPEIFSSLMNKS